MSRLIMHVDLDAFFCSVEELHDPSLKGKPFVVGGSPDGRGVVSSASYAARAFGVRSALPTKQALLKCPPLLIVSGHHSDYSMYSKRVMSILRDYCRAFEQISIDEAFLDVTGLHEDSRVIANEIQTRIRNEVGLPASVGVACNKLVAKVASDCAKPNGVLIVDEGEESAFLSPMLVGELWGIGKATAAQLETIGIRTIGQLATADVIRLRMVFGAHVKDAMRRARGVDDSPVSEFHEAKSISTERTFAHDINDHAVLRATLLSMSDEVAFRLRADGLFASTVQVKLRWSDFTTITRQSAFDTATQLSNEIFTIAERLWLDAWIPRQRVRLIGVGVSELTHAGEQLPLFDYEKREHQQELAHTTDRLRAKYGGRIIGRASQHQKQD